MTPGFLLGWVAAAVYAVVFVAAARVLRSRRPALAEYPPAAGGRLVSVIVPARNEAVNIEACVRSILSNTYESLEVIVVDDRSEDATAALVEGIAASGGAGDRVRLIRGSEPPPSWFGKQWAMMQGYRVARGDLLLFADADTRHEPELVARAVAVLDREHVDLVTVIPRQEMGSFWERLLQPHVLFALGSRLGDLRRMNRTRTPWDAIANGQFILTTRAAYEAVGTHERVRDTVVDDLAIAQAYVASRKDIFLAHAQPYMRTRMYRSLGEIVAGWTKNLALGAPQMLPPLPWLRRALPWFMWLPSIAWIAPPLAWALVGWPFALAATLVSLALWVLVYRTEGVPVGYALLYPLAAAIVAFIMLRSALRGRRVEWKGRVYGSVA